MKFFYSAYFIETNITFIDPNLFSIGNEIRKGQNLFDILKLFYSNDGMKIQCKKFSLKQFLTNVNVNGQNKKDTFVRHHLSPGLDSIVSYLFSYFPLPYVEFICCHHFLLLQKFISKLYIDLQLLFLNQNVRNLTKF